MNSKWPFNFANLPLKCT